MTTYSISSKMLLASVLVTVAMGCGDDDDGRQDAGETPQDSSTADVTTGDDDAGGDDAGELGDGATLDVCSEAEEEFLETPFDGKKDTTFYEALAVGVETCQKEEDFDACLIEAIDDESDGIVGEECAVCLIGGVSCLGVVCAGECDENPSSAECIDCRCGRTEATANCVEGLERCTGYEPTLCLDIVG